MNLFEQMAQEIILLEKKDHLIKKLDGLTDQQKQQVIQHFQKFPHLENKIDWNKKDLSWDDFKPLLNQVSKTQKNKQVSKKGIAGLKEGVDYIKHPSNKFEGYFPLTHQASRLIASSKVGNCEGKWCIATNNPEHWNQYTNDEYNFLYIIKNGKKYAIAYHPKINNIVEIFDQNDGGITKKELEEVLGVSLSEILDPSITSKINIKSGIDVYLDAVDDRKMIRLPNHDPEMTLREIIDSERFNDNYLKANLNFIDVSNVQDMSSLFEDSEFNGDISKWNVSNATDMTQMFANSNFNGDISRWDVSNVIAMDAMFQNSKFNKDISNWDVNAEYMDEMFDGSDLEKNGNLPQWWLDLDLDLDDEF